MLGHAAGAIFTCGSGALDTQVRGGHMLPYRSGPHWEVGDMPSPKEFLRY